ncbi:MAG: filamentous hemagglutinin N-terminal domain-containing protein, partial [Planctomycetaceae bacterium]|nr:filamentous hemagglutinin N-terminal domain-containing protein [Planctomycetaceae bacterium]
GTSAMAGDLPTGGDVVAGQAVISATQNTLNIDAASNRSIINWNSFNIGAGNTANFNLPDSTASVLNRVTSNNMPSTIAGTLNSNGNILLVNPSGIVVSSSGMINTNGFAASVFDIGNAEFMKGGALRFSNSGSDAAITNNGTISTGDGGAHLIANQIVNHGTITSQGGNITLSGGGEVTLQNGVTYVQPTLETLAGGISPTAGLIQNTGTIRATGAATVGGEVYLVNPSGKILHDGTIAARYTAEPGTMVNSRGRDADAPTAGADHRQDAYTTVTGGHVQLEATDITLTENSLIDATGAQGGGDILIGGDWQGSGEMHQATRVTIESGAVANASATHNGDGGKIVAWSDVKDAHSRTSVHGMLKATGGINGGNGGQIETSGHSLNTSGIYVNAGSENQSGGLWLLDPTDSTIDQVIADSYAATLNTGTSVVNEVTGSIIVNDDVVIEKTVGGDATLTLKASETIAIGERVSITSTSNRLNLVFRSDSDANHSGRVAAGVDSSVSTNGGHVWIGGGSGDTTWNGLTVGDGVAAFDATAGSNNVISWNADVTTSGGDILLTGDADFRTSVGSILMDLGAGDATFIGGYTAFGSATEDAVLQSTGHLSIIGKNHGGFLPFRGSYVGADYTVNGSGVIYLNIININNLTGLTIGDETSTNRLYFDGDNANINGPVSLLSGVEVRIEGGVSTSSAGAAGTINVKSGGEIYLSSGTTLTTNGGDVTFWADTDANNDGTISLIESSITTNGGDILFSGGSDLATGYATHMATGVGGGTSYSIVDPSYGIFLLTSNLSAGTGDVTLRGQSLGTAEDGNSALLIQGVGTQTTITGNNITIVGVADTAATMAGDGSANRGLSMWNSTLIGSGSVSITGTGATGTGGLASNSGGVRIGNSQVGSTGADVQITGTGRGAGEFNSGVTLESEVFAATTITINGTGSANGTGAGGNGVNIRNSSASVHSTSSGAISITGTRGTGDAGNLTYGIALSNDATLGTTGSSSDISLIADEIDIFAAPVTLDTSGVLTVAPLSDSFASPLDWSMTDLTLIQTLSGLVLGKDGNTADITLGLDQVVNGDVSIYGGDIHVNGGVDTRGAAGLGAILAKATGDIRVNGGIDISTNGGDVTFWSDADSDSDGAIFIGAAASL